MTDVPTPNESVARGAGGHGSEGLADYRADRDDFSRLLYLVFQEIRAQEESNPERSS
ncbi:MAG: hypothetical protein L0099_01975 [Acidobacteria bacterium]|nr:hypothetical protein [Acidobacteriota bacterium]